MTPDAGYYVDSLFVDFVHVDSTTSYTFYNVTAHHTISVLFSANAPTLTSVTPDSAARGVSVDVVLVGGNFIAGVSTVNADGDISVTSVTVHSIDTIYATLSIASSAVLGAHNLSVTNAAPGGGTSSAVVLNVLASLAVKDKKGRIPTEYALYQNYPNPFNPSTRIDFDLPQTSIVTLTVYNILGQEVVSLLNGEEMEMGVQTVTFSEGDLTSGIYFYRIRAEGANGKTFTSVKRMLLMK